MSFDCVYRETKLFSDFTIFLPGHHEPENIFLGWRKIFDTTANLYLRLLSQRAAIDLMSYLPLLLVNFLGSLRLVVAGAIQSKNHGLIS